MWNCWSKLTCSLANMDPLSNEVNKKYTSPEYNDGNSVKICYETGITALRKIQCQKVRF